MFDVVSIKCARTAHQPMHFVSFSQKKFGTKYDPSCPVMPVMSARFFAINVIHCSLRNCRHNVKNEKVKARTKCRISGEKLVPLFSLGKLYLSDFIEHKETPKYEPVELALAVVLKSGLVQLQHTVPGDVMYRKYWYKSGTNATMTNELMGIAKKAQEVMNLKKGDVFLDIGCNDGTLFRFVDPEIIRIGFDPNDFKKNRVSTPTLSSTIILITRNIGKQSTYHKKAKVITSIAMFYDLEDPGSFVNDIRKTLDKNGLWIIQMSYLPLMLKQLVFDNICHEHLEYYSLESLQYLLQRHKLQIVDCELNDINGGSFRIYIRHDNANPATFATAPYRDVAHMSVDSILGYEKSLQLNKKKIYKDFWEEINALKKTNRSFHKKGKEEGKGYMGLRRINQRQHAPAVVWAG